MPASWRGRRRRSGRRASACQRLSGARSCKPQRAPTLAAPTISVTAGCQPAKASTASLTAHSSIHPAPVHSGSRTTARSLPLCRPRSRSAADDARVPPRTEAAWRPEARACPRPPPARGSRRFQRTCTGQQYATGSRRGAQGHHQLLPSRNRLNSSVGGIVVCCGLARRERRARERDEHLIDCLRKRTPLTLVRRHNTPHTDQSGLLDRSRLNFRQTARKYALTFSSERFASR